MGWDKTEKLPLTMCDYINHVTFMHIEDVGDCYKLLMKSLVASYDEPRPAFYTLTNKEIATYKYYILFNKNDNYQTLQEADKIYEPSTNRGSYKE